MLILLPNDATDEVLKDVKSERRHQDIKLENLRRA